MQFFFFKVFSWWRCGKMTWKRRSAKTKKVLGNRLSGPLPFNFIFCPKKAILVHGRMRSYTVALLYCTGSGVDHDWVASEIQTWSPSLPQKSMLQKGPLSNFGMIIQDDQTITVILTTVLVIMTILYHPPLPPRRRPCYMVFFVVLLVVLLLLFVVATVVITKIQEHAYC